MIFFLAAFVVILSYYPSVSKVGNEPGLNPSEIDEMN